MKKIISIFLVLILEGAFAQPPTTWINEARELASGKYYEAAMQVISDGLKKYPKNRELTIYQVRILLWSEAYFEAEKQINVLYHEYPAAHEVHQLRSTLHWWQENWEELLVSSEEALQFFPNDVDFKKKKLLALKNLERYKEASDYYLTLDGQDPQLKALGAEVKLKHHRQIGFIASHSHFTQSFAPWALGTIRYQHISSNSFNVSATYAKMFGQTGTSFNAEYYPKLARGLYGFFEAGGSPSVIFPEIRGGGEVTAQVENLEFFGGGKMIRFRDQAEAAKIITFGMGWYYGQFYTSYRGFLAEVGATRSLTNTLLIRRSFQNRFHYVQLNLSNGNIPLQINTFSEVSRHNASAGSLMYSFLPTETLIANISVGGQFEEYLTGVKRMRYTATVGLSKVF